MAAGDKNSEKTTDDKILEEKKKLLDVQIASLGCEHAKTLGTRHQIAAQLYQMSRYSEALAIYKDVYPKCSAILGHDHHNTIATHINIALTYAMQDRLEESVAVFIESYEKYYAKLGPDHQEMQRVLHNIEFYLQKLQKYDEASEICGKPEQGLGQVLQAKEKWLDVLIATLGCKHKKTLDTQNDIALHLFKISRYDEALIIFKEVYDKSLSILGPSHDSTIAVQSSIAATCIELDHLDEAEDLLKDIYEKCVEKFGPTHEKTLEILRFTGIHFQKQEKYDEAFETYDKMQQGLCFQYNMACELRNGKYAEKALEFFCKIHEKALQNRIPDEEETLTAKFRSGKALVEIKEHEEVSNILDMVSPNTTNLKASFEDTILACRYTGIAFYKAGMVKAGLKLLHKAYRRSKKKFGPDHQKTLKFQTDFGSALYSTEKYDEALRVYNDMYDIQASRNDVNLDAYKMKLIIADIHNKLEDCIQAQKAYSEAEKNFNGDYIEKVKAKRELLFSFLMKEKDSDTEGLNICYERYREMEKTLGPTHPEALAAYEEIIVHSTKYIHLLGILEDLYTTRKDVLGNDHLDTLRTGQQMADVHAKNHNYFDAIRVYAEVYEIRKKLPFTMSTYYCLTNLAAMLCLMKEYELSCYIYEERFRMQISEDQENETHLEKNIVHTLVKDNIQNNDILNAFQKLFQEADKIRGRNNRVTIEIIYTIAEILRVQGKYYDALQAFKSVEKSLENLPSFHSDDIIVLNIRNNVREMYESALLSRESYKVLGKHYQTLKLTVGPGDPKCLDAQIHLARSLYLVQKSDAALSHFLDVYQKIKKTLGPEHPNEPGLYALYKFIQELRSKIPNSKMVESIRGNDFDSFRAVIEKFPRKVNICDLSGAISLHYAARLGKIEYVRHLVWAGSFYNLEDKLGETPLEYSSSDEIKTLLLEIDSFFLAVKEGDEEYVTMLIEGNKIVINAVDKEGNNGVHWACEKEYLKIIKMLLKHGTDVLVRNNDGENAIHIAIRKENVNIIDILGQHVKNKYVKNKLSKLKKYYR